MVAAVQLAVKGIFLDVSRTSVWTESTRVGWDFHSVFFFFLALIP